MCNSTLWSSDPGQRTRVTILQIEEDTDTETGVFYTQQSLEQSDMTNLHVVNSSENSIVVVLRFVVQMPLVIFPL